MRQRALNVAILLRSTIVFLNKPFQVVSADKILKLNAASGIAAVAR